MHYNMAAFSHEGGKKGNQDSYLTLSLSDGQHVLAIADGVGGREGGELASKLAINEVSKLFRENSQLNISEVFRRVKNALIEESKTKGLLKMATTLTLCYINNEHVFVGHVGDCRLYHLRGSGIITKTKDQSEKQKLIDAGVLTKERARSYHRRNILFSVISSDIDYELYETDFYIKPDDRLLLLSDGAYNLCSKRELIELSFQSKELDDWISNITSLVGSKIVKDDYTGVGFEIKK